MNRINQRDGANLILEVVNGVPLCPHCRKPMVLCGGKWENAMCACWWKGANDANYFAQVVVSVTAEEEFQFRSDQEKQTVARKEESEARLFSARLAYAAGTNETKFKIIHDLCYLYGKRNKQRRIRVKKAISNGATFDEAYEKIRSPSDSLSPCLCDARAGWSG